MKLDLVRKRGETLIQVPCWWDGLSERFFFASFLTYFSWFNYA